VDAEERQAGIGHGIDQAAHEFPSFRSQAQISAAKGNDAVVELRATTQRKPVRPTPGAEDGEAGAQLTPLMPEHEPSRRWPGAPNATARHYAAAFRPHILGQRLGDPAEINHAGGRRVEGGHAPRGRLVFGDLVRSDTDESGDAV